MADAIIAPPAPVNLPRVLVCTGSGAPVYGGAGAAAKILASPVIRGGTVAPSSLLELTGFFEFSGNNTSREVSIALGGTKIADAFPDVGINCFQFQTLLWVDPTAKSIRVMDIRLNGTLQPHRALNDSSGGNAGMTTLAAIIAGPSYAQSDLTAIKNAIAQLAARTLGNGSVFRGDNALKTTYAIDLTADCLLTVSAKPQNGDTAELIGLTAVNYAEAGMPRRSNAAANALACFGDSLTYGSGSVTPVGGWVSQLRIAEAGRSVANFGVPGETAEQIVDRFIADKERSKFWNSTLVIGRNDVGVASDLTATVMTQLARAMRARSSGVKTVIGTIIPAAAENDATPLGTSIAACNIAIKNTYGGRTGEGIAVCDLYATLATDPGHVVPASLRFDTIHPNDTGYGQVRTAMSAALATIGG